MGGSAYYLVSGNPMPVHDKLRTMQGKICRPVVPTSVREVRDYWEILSTTKELQATSAAGAGTAGIAGGAWGFFATRGVASWWKRLFWRVMFIPTLSSAAAGVGGVAVLLMSVNTIRDKLTSVVTPVGSTTETILRVLLPKAAASALEFPEMK